MNFKSRPITLPHTHTRFWFRYMEHTFVIQKAEHSHQVLQQINSMDPYIQCTAETANTGGSIPFLTLNSHQDQAINISLQVTRNLSSEINTFIGITTMTCMLGKMFLMLSETELGQFVLTLSCCISRRNT